ncbi:hypothetical protein PTTG_25231 [Puccinia triticina 1-1 BBBD Race 1]|uniref:Uncharacterized protein n=1 Tax=Puccinia triticina (isolate 1-1 / race 1 (BBBD)) TaxID=630390 RepID=A0A180H4M3_PUCT1|nr:hypothetical protein PTTG_25231 [Puccinia triticina 1-1 BBBD Race 1]
MSVDSRQTSSPSQSFQNQNLRTTSLIETIDLGQDEAGTSTTSTNRNHLASEEDDSAPIDLYTRMLQKTRRIQLENRRLRKRSPKGGDKGGDGGGQRGGGGGGNNADKNQCLVQGAIQNGAFTDGKPTGAQSPSLTSPNNFINFCLTSFGKVGGAEIMNGKQLEKKPGCNGIVMGMVPDQNHMPSCKFIKPKNLDEIPAKKPFTITLKVRNIVLGVFTNPKNTYLQGPVQLDPETKSVLGHTHVVIQPINSLDSTDVPDPTVLVFFKGVDGPAKKEEVIVDVKDGLEPGFYRISTITTAANHQPISSPVARRSIYDDIIYVTAK